MPSREVAQLICLHALKEGGSEEALSWAATAIAELPTSFT
jgi:hypothetical protein